MEEELRKQLLIRGTKGSSKVVLTEEGMILCHRAEEILSLVQKAEEEITHSDDTIAGDVVIGAGETDSVRLLAKPQRACKSNIQIFTITSPAGMRNMCWNIWIRG